ncbi:MAG: DUF1080 domain-containing protein [Chitinophagaceae bacterium]|nr:DUF1080 domain-containing protein [Chitinophagaceae bacterium]
MKRLIIAFLATGVAVNAFAQVKMKPEETEVWNPVPQVVTPGDSYSKPPSDAVVLFDGKDLSKWESTNRPGKAAGWKVHDGILTVDKKAGNIQTKESFMDYQLHIEWRIPEDIDGSGQLRGNSGLFLASTGKGDRGYEIQILDNYNNKTYVNGQAGSVYKQYAPLVNANKKPGEWQSYDVIWKAPRFNADGSLKDSARVTVIFNGVLIQNNVALKGETVYIGYPKYLAHDASPIKLQAHGDPSKPISFRNIWIRKL